MALSPLKIPAINTIPILSTAASFTYTFELNLSNTAQWLWSQFVYVADATAGTRIIVARVRDENAVLTWQQTYFQTVAAGGTLIVQFMQGNTIIPPSVLGTHTTLPIDGLFFEDQWTLEFFDFSGVSAGDTFSGMFQTRGFHNSLAPP